MMKMGLKRGFTLVELLIVVAILALLSGLAYIGVQRSQVRVMNEKVATDLNAIQNALEAYKDGKDNGDMYPLPAAGADKNLTCYNIDTSYNHLCTELSGAAFIQSQIDNNLLTKKYLQEVPTDPRTGARYVYGVTTDGQSYQVAGIIENDDGTYSAKVVSNLHFSYPLRSLIRAYNGPEFVMDAEDYLPYSPDHLAVTATLDDVTNAVTIDGVAAADGSVATPGAKIVTDATGSTTLYFSDGSITYLDPNSELRILSSTGVDQNDKDGIVTKIKLKLLQGKVWNKVARLAQKSEFNIETTSAIAGVRGTEFGIDAANQLVVLSGDVAARVLDINEQVPDDESFDFSKDDPSFASGNIITGDETDFNVFTIPGANAPGTSPSGTPAAGDYSKYYQQPYSNNLEPRIYEIDVPNGVLKFKLFEEGTTTELRPLKSIVVYEEGDLLHPVATWTLGVDFSIDTQIKTADISSAVLVNFFTTPNFGKSYVFYMVDDAENRSAPTDPSILIDDNTYLTWDMLFGGETIASSSGGGQGGGGGGQGPVITTIPSSIELGTEATIASDSNCDWTITGGGALIGTTTDVQTVQYESIDSSMTVDQKILDVGARFGNAFDNTITVVCSNSSGTDTKTFVVGYAPWKYSTLSLYEYSWFAAGSTDWYNATTICQNLTEGGVTPGTWNLPSQVLYDDLDGTPNNSKTDPAEGAYWCGTWTGSDCSDMPDGVAAIWLEEEFPGVPTDAYYMPGSPPGDSMYGYAKTPAQSWLGFRCVK